MCGETLHSVSYQGPENFFFFSFMLFFADFLNFENM